MPFDMHVSEGRAWFGAAPSYHGGAVGQMGSDPAGL